MASLLEEIAYRVFGRVLEVNEVVVILLTPDPIPSVLSERVITVEVPVVYTRARVPCISDHIPVLFRPRHIRAIPYTIVLAILAYTYLVLVNNVVRYTLYQLFLEHFFVLVLLLYSSYVLMVTASYLIYRHILPCLIKVFFSVNRLL